MSQFEYLNRFAVGQYLPTGSIVHQLDPRARIVGFTVLILALTLTTTMTGLAAALMLTLLLLTAAKVPMKFAMHGLLAPLPFILILAVLQLFITRGQDGDVLYFSWRFLAISSSGVHAAILLVLRFLGLILLPTLATAALSTLELIYGLDLLFKPLQKIGLNTRPVTMVVQVMLRFIPSLLLSAEKIAKAQASRGAAWGSASGGLLKRPLILPLFSTSLQQADVLTQAMLARGYGSKAERTGLRQYSFKWKDLGFVILSAAAAAAVI